MKIAYLGPYASFSSLAAIQLFPNAELYACASIRDCFHALQSGDAVYAVVPLENSIEGTVSMTLDYLYGFKDICIVAEAVMPVEHQLLVHPENTGFSCVMSHPQALAQCFHFLEENYKDVQRRDYHSTAAAAKYVADHPEQPIAAIANRSAANLYGLKIVHENIHDFEQNHTRFIVISRNVKQPNFNLKRVSEKSSLLLTLPDDHAGGLHQALSVFAWRNMNLSKIESRTLKTGLGKYFFFINVEGIRHPLLFGNAIQELQLLAIQVKFLGHYNEYLLS